MRRAPISAPAPGPNGMTKRTGRCGQSAVCPCAAGGGNARSATTEITQAWSFDISQGPNGGVGAGSLLTSFRHGTFSPPAGQANPDATDGIKLKAIESFYYKVTRGD